ncbi:MAG: ribonuclease H-like domain-containing protein [Thermoplasmata archaeon]|nr:ribonuclease H-like domain-containing protein [Thermoplasmata archaeon]
MKKYWAMVLDASYHEENGSVVIDLYCRTREGKSLTARVHGFNPYFYVVAPPPAVVEELRNHEEVLDVEPYKLYVKGRETDCVKVTIKHPYKVPELRKKFPDGACLAADIPFHLRFFFDMDLSLCTEIAGEDAPEDVRRKYTTELVVETKELKPVPPFKVPLVVMSFDIENSISSGKIYVISYAIRKGNEIIKGAITSDTDDEQEILKNFADLVRKHDPDVLAGYNIGGYDIPLLTERAKAHGITLDVGRDFGTFSVSQERFWRIHGRIVLDVWLTAKMRLRPKQETLNFIAKMLLGEEKEDVNRLKIDEEWKQRREAVISYCIKDAELALRILEEIAEISRGMDIAAVAKLPLDDVIDGRTSTLIDSLVIREADRRRVGVPMNKFGGSEAPIEGGYVHSIRPGLYHWVIVCDFKSMYPSIIISNNICFTTIAEDGEIVSPCNVRFMSRERKRGIVPDILENLMGQREEFKKKAKRAKTEEEKAYYDGLQNAVKILMNSFYGVFASSFYRFTDKSIGASITAFARENIKNLIGTLETEGHRVIYSDTDSVFFQSPYPNLEQSIKFGEETAARFSKNGLTLEFERILEPFFSHGKKKRYVGKAVWPKEEIVVRGYETRRTDSFDWQSEALMEVFETVLNSRDEEDLKKNVIAKAKLLVEMTLRGEVPVEKLVISRSVRDFDSYKDAARLAHVEVAKQMIAKGYEFIPGMKVSWIVVDAKKTPQKVEPYVEGRVFNGKPDYEYYARRVAMTLARVLEVFGYDEESLFSGRRQASLAEGSLDSFVVPEKEKEEKTEPKRKFTLEDFM